MKSYRSKKLASKITKKTRLPEDSSPKIDMRLSMTREIENKCLMTTFPSKENNKLHYCQVKCRT